MNTKFTIKNFRVFDENGVSIDIRPLTILTGCNSSGKSSIVKAAFLLNSFMKQVNKAIENGEEIELSKYKIDFTGYPNNLLGRFDKVIPFGSSSQKMTLGYTIHSCLLSKDVDVELVFAADKNDDLNNAYLDNISMSTDEGAFYSSSKEEGSFYNLNIIKRFCPDFLRIEFLINSFCGLDSAYRIGLEESVSDEEYETQTKLIFEALRGFDRNKVLDVADYIRTKRGKYEEIASKEKMELIDWTEQNDSYFNIPVLEYLNSVKKDAVLSTVEELLASNEKDNSLLSSDIAVNSATNKVINDFIGSDFTFFSDYFKNFEKRHFESIHNNDNNAPCMPRVYLNQNYTPSYPGCGINISWESVNLFDDDKGIDQRNEKEEDLLTQQKIEKWEKQSLSFDILYEVVMIWNEKYIREKSRYYDEGADVSDGSGNIFTFPNGYHHHVFGMLTTFVTKIAEEAICPLGFFNMSYVSSSRATVKKLYALDEKDDFTELLQRYFENKRVFQEKSAVKSSNTPDYEVNSFLTRWVKQFGIGDYLSFKLDEEGLGVKIYLHKSSENNVRLLSDEGYGITQLISILLQIETAIISAQGQKCNKFIGLSAFDKYDDCVFHFEENTIVIEEPEIHLHPNYQSKLAEMFAEAYSKYNIHFIIETHSEYLIRKLQTFVAHKKIESNDVSICYVYSKEDYVSPSDSRVKHLPIKEDGNLADSFGPGFFDEADNLSVELMSLKMEKS